jgi:2-polyprenyl-3-methyl-5-hydroxy-6-metoxy-1,4-benzoquinol methylase
MTEYDYAFDPAWERERERLSALERTFDEGTARHLETIGVAPGWHCLEVGAGGGTIAAWLCERVGPDGRVVATDMDTRFIERLEYPNLEVLRHDITQDPLKDQSFDLIHARTVLEHIPVRDDVVPRLVRALKPGGWLMLEDVDLTPVLHVPAEAWFVVPEHNKELVLRVNRAIREVVTSVGADLEYGGRLPAVLMAQGLVDVDAELQSRLVRGNSARAEYSRLTIELLREALEERLEPEDLEETLSRHSDPDAAWMSIPMVVAWGRRPVEPLGPAE